MAYTVRNFKSGKALKEAVKSGEKIEVYQPSPWGKANVPDGWTCIEGPHYPQPHTFYVGVIVKNGYIEKLSNRK
jgi:hypothetical protein